MKRSHVLKCYFSTPDQKNVGKFMDKYLSNFIISYKTVMICRSQRTMKVL
ncbi:Uncharacterized protein dnm_077960 [Desulfonema magnum]|uniref:Uncharacterized protein n=1 Tax=Desulfonema magnum TaxID=45655 RepID=A0A975GSA9_9BACT|nr:Uncharacterized protein dnm_077960 [Desulfonema magnum]